MFITKKSAVIVIVLLVSADVSSHAQASTPGASSSDSKPQPTASTAPSKPAAPPDPNTLLDGTPVKLRLDRTVSSADAHVGDTVDFDVLEEIKVNGIVVVAKGALALATVTTAEHKKNMGRGGKLDVNIDSVRLVDEEKVALRATEGGKGGGHVGAMTGAMVATSIVFFPAAPLFLFMHGKDITIPKGTEVTAYINGDMPLNMSKLTGKPDAETTVANGMSQVNVDADVANCDIEVDGAFVGNTPSQISVTTGKHELSVKKKGYQTWARTLNVSGGGVNLKAEMAPEAAPAPASPATPPVAQTLVPAAK